MSYRVELKQSAGKALALIPAHDRERILEAIDSLKNHPRPVGSKNLVGRQGWRIRSQSYRVIDDIDDAAQRIVVEIIGHRRDFYQ